MKLNKSSNEANYAAKVLYMSCNERNPSVMVFPYHVRLQTCRHRSELQFQILAAAVHQNAFVSNPLRRSVLVV